jgi:hypothetical protein
LIFSLCRKASKRFGIMCPFSWMPTLDFQPGQVDRSARTHCFG